MVTKILGLVVALAALLLPAAPASATVPCNGFTSASGQCFNTSVTVGGTSYNADWYVPTGQARALMVLEHGFSRGCGNLRNTSKAILERGVMVLCLNASMQGGNPALGRALGDALADRTLTPPNGAVLPAAYIVGGHSAGGHFASVVGARLAERGYPQLRGAVLFDPVASDGFSANLQAISAGGSRPVLAVAARGGLANLYNNAFGALRGLPGDYSGIQLLYANYVIGIPVGGSCHTDVEGENGDFIGNLAVGCTPSTTNVARLRDFGATWASDLATGTRTDAYYCAATCGTKVRDLVNRKLAATIG